MTASPCTRWIFDPDTWLGMSVDVLLVNDNTEHVGTIVALGPFRAGDGPICEHYPTIELDDGRRIGGLDCWWTKRETPS